METKKLPYLNTKNVEPFVTSLARRHLIIVEVNGLRLIFRDDDLFLDFVDDHLLQEVQLEIDPHRTGLWVKVNQPAIERI